MHGNKDQIFNLNKIKIDNSEYNSLSRQIIKNKDILYLKDLKIAFFSNYTLEILEPYMIVEFAKQGYLLSANYNAYGLIESKLFDPESDVYKNNFDLFFIDLKFEDIFSDFNDYQINLNEKKINELILFFENYLISMFDSIRNNFKSNIFISNFSSIANNIESSFMQNMSASRYDLIHKMNSKLKKIVSSYSQIYIHDFYTFCLNYGFNNFVDNKMFYLAAIPIKIDYQSKLSFSFSRTVFNILNIPKKCLVCDLDNTLWGGVLGEDGYKSIQLGDNFPGNIYKDFQKTILNLRDIGIFIAIASKNNENEVINFMNNNKDCLIKTEHISVMKANWLDKATNIIEIAKELNIGLDSIVFFDDSKHEREWVKNQLPEVNVIEVPNNPVDYKKTLVESNYFNKFAISQEDRLRSNLFAIEKKRKLSKIRFQNIEDYIISLKIELLISPLNSQNIHRVVQLINKTNQFNLTTKRYNENDLLILQNKKSEIYTIRVLDKYGDSGLTGVFILEPLPNNIWKIDTFLLSCRILGRNIEKSILNFISKKLLKKNGKEILGEFFPTKKNIIAKDFYSSLKFKKKTANLWVWQLKNGTIYNDKSCKILEKNE